MVDKILDYAERYVLTRLHTVIFELLDEEKDLQLQNRIRSLHWVSPDQLETLINENDHTIQYELDSAITG